MQLQRELHTCIIQAAHVLMAEHPNQRASAQMGLPAVLTLAWAAWLTLPGQKSSPWSGFFPQVFHILLTHKCVLPFPQYHLLCITIF